MQNTYKAKKNSELIFESNLYDINGIDFINKESKEVPDHA